jgi:hypothetical protein
MIDCILDGYFCADMPGPHSYFNIFAVFSLLDLRLDMVLSTWYDGFLGPILAQHCTLRVFLLCFFARWQDYTQLLSPSGVPDHRRSLFHWSGCQLDAARWKGEDPM